MTLMKIKAAARMLGLGLIVGTMSASTVLAGGKGGKCPFTSKDIDAWHKDIGFDGGSAEVGDRRNSATCTTDGVTWATLEKTERALGQVIVDAETGETAQGIKTNKQMLIHVHMAGAPEYQVELIANGVDLSVSPTFPLAGILTPTELAACIDAVTSSQAYTRWSCPMK